MDKNSQPQAVKPQHGQTWLLLDGRRVTILGRSGDSWKAINEAGMLEMVYPGQLKTNATNQH